MCGRYASSRSAAELMVEFEADEPPEQVLPPSWNVAPTDPVHVVLERDGRRLLRVVRWGLVPWFEADTRGAARRINARRETVATTPAYRSAYRRRRCLVPADGYYEWRRTGAGKQPWFFAARTTAPLAMAGLYEVWGPPGEQLWSCTVATTDAADEHGAVHDRTPLLVAREHWRRWLDPGVPDPGADLLVAGVSGALVAHPVSAAVGNVRNNGPQLVEPVPAGG